MVHYSCDVCGKAMPQGYVRTKCKTSASMILTATKVTDVCEPCLQRGLAIDIPALILSAWREQKESGTPKIQLEEGDLLREKFAPGPAGKIGASKKREIRARLITYRDLHGPGCLENVANKIPSKRITSGELRDVIIGGINLTAGEWRLIDQALDKIEIAEAENAKNA